MLKTANSYPTSKILLLIGGYSCLIMTYGLGPLGNNYLYQILNEWQQILLVQFIYFVGQVLGCLVLRAIDQPQPSVLQYSLYGGVTILLFVIVYLGLLDLNLLILSAVSFIAGVVAAYPMLFWVDRLRLLYQQLGWSRCVIVLIACHIIEFIIMGILSLFILSNIIILFITIGIILITIVCQYFSSQDNISPFLSLTEWQEKKSNTIKNYHLTKTSLPILICFGGIWGICFASLLSFNTSTEGNLFQWISLITNLLTCFILIILFSRKNYKGIQFGSLIRLTLTVAGIVLISTAFLNNVLPNISYYLCEIVYLLTAITMTLFSVQTSYKTGLRTLIVYPINMALFTISGCVFGLLFWVILNFIGGQTAWEIITILGSLAVIMTIPFLPSRHSDAVTFTLDELPENEGYDARIAQRRTNLSGRYGLTKRETEVLELLMRGMTRQQIADELAISPWTVKDRTSSIYEKLNVHSYKELTQLINNDED